MIKNNKGEVILKGTEVEIKAELATLFIALYKLGYNKEDIFESLSYAEMFNKDNMKFEKERNKEKRKYRKWKNF